MRALVALVLVAFTLPLAGCGRDAGPNDDEIGQEIVWQIIPSRRTSHLCSSSAAMANYEPQMPTFDDTGIVYYVIYAADPGKKTATDSDCPEPMTDWNQCRPGTGKLPISGHTITLSDQSGAGVVGDDCQMTWRDVYTVTDHGEDGTLQESLSYKLADDAACQAFEASADGKGIDGCTSTIQVGLIFVLTKSW